MLPSDRVLKHQFRARNYQHYLELVQELLQAEKHDELTMKNHHQHHVGMGPLQEVNYSSKGKEKVDGNNHPKNVGKFKKQEQEEQIQRSKFRERKEIFQMPPLWWS
jgi:hypothetical protein